MGVLTMTNAFLHVQLEHVQELQAPLIYTEKPTLEFLLFFWRGKKRPSWTQVPSGQTGNKSWGWGGDRDTDRASEGRSSLPEVWPCRLWSLKKTEGFAALHTIFDTPSNLDTFHLYSLFQILLRALRTKNWKPWRRDPRDGLPPPANNSLRIKTHLIGKRIWLEATRGLQPSAACVVLEEAASAHNSNVETDNLRCNWSMPEFAGVRGQLASSHGKSGPSNPANRSPLRQNQKLPRLYNFYSCWNRATQRVNPSSIAWCLLISWLKG